MIKEPKKFVGLHSHSTYSVGDAIGTPGEHIDFCLENGLDAHAITDHGNFHAFSHQYLHGKKLQKKGVNFKNIYGQEFYFVDSLERWQELYVADKEFKREEKARKAEAKRLGDAYAETKNEMDTISEEKELTTVIENEEDTKSNKFKNPINQRNHLVLLAKNDQGLKSLFRLNSEAYINGFYRYPRIDFDLIKKHAKGNIIASSACIGGKLARVVFDHQVEAQWELWEPNDTNIEVIQAELKEVVERFQDALGPENFNLEIQWNSIGAQHLVNYHLIECARITGAPLIATADAHYPVPDQWREREIYKMMAWMTMTKGDGDKDKLPKTIDELKCELYPKNAQQMWEAYKKYGSKYDFYDDQICCDAIERTWDIAHEQIDVVEIDKSYKLPALNKIIDKDVFDKLEDDISPEGEEEVAFGELVKLARKGFINRGLKEKPNKDEYLDRIKVELDVIRHLKLSKYFLTYAKIMEIAGQEMLLGSARGSAAGSLLSYAVGITQVDPIRFGLLFERFLSKKKAGMADIDSDFSDRDRACQLLREYFGEENVIPVTNFNQLQMRSLVKDISRLNGLPFEQINEYTKKIENEARATAKKQPGYDAAQWVLTFEEALENSETFRELIEKYPDFEKTVKTLFKQIRNCFTDNVKILTDNGYKVFSEITKGKDKVAYVDFHNNVLFNDTYDCISQGQKEVYEITLDNGTTLELTEDHEVMTTKGYKEVKNLNEDDEIVSV
jgi:DNA polymerase III alpha subunit